MKIKKIRQLIRANIKGTSGLNLIDATSQVEKAQTIAYEAVSIGIKTDADAVIFFEIINNTIIIFLYVGKSISLAAGIYEYLLKYHNGNHENTNHCIEWLVDNATDNLKNEDETFIVLRDEGSDRWRGFSGDKILSLNEIEARAMMSLH